MQPAAKDSTPEPDSPPADLVKKALAMGLAFEEILAQATRGVAASFRLRLARAHALSALDALTELIHQGSAGDPKAAGEPPTSQSGVYTMVDGERRRIEE